MSALYQKSMAALDKIVPAKLQPLWRHPAGNRLLNHNTIITTVDFRTKNHIFLGASVQMGKWMYLIKCQLRIFVI